MKDLLKKKPKPQHSCIALITEIHCISHAKQQPLRTHRDRALQIDSQITLYNKGHSLLNVFYLGLIQSPGRSLQPVGLVLMSKAKRNTPGDLAFQGICHSIISNRGISF